MAKIAILGFGTVGSGVLEVCRRNAASIARRAGEPVEVKYILDVRDFSASPDAALFFKGAGIERAYYFRDVRGHIFLAAIKFHTRL